MYEPPPVYVTYGDFIRLIGLPIETRLGIVQKDLIYSKNTDFMFFIKTNNYLFYFLFFKSVLFEKIQLYILSKVKFVVQFKKLYSRIYIYFKVQKKYMIIITIHFHAFTNIPSKNLIFKFSLNIEARNIYIYWDLW